MKALQLFTDEYLESCRDMTPDQVLEFLEDFRTLHSHRQGPAKLISLKVPIDLLRAFRAKASLAGAPYQTQIKVLMREWVTGASR